MTFSTDSSPWTRLWQRWKRRWQQWQRVPWVTYTILVVTVLVFGLQTLSEAWIGQDLLAAWGMKWAPGIVEGQLWRLITPVFLHGGVTHLLLNMYALYVLGPELEMTIGKGRFALLYFLTGYTGVAVSFALEPRPALGASTAIFGLLGGYIVFYFQHRDLLGKAAVVRMSNALLWAGINLVYGAMASYIDNWGHIGGLLGGMTFMALGGPQYTVQYDLATGRSVLVNRQAWSRTFIAAIGVALMFGLFLWSAWSRFA